jgi:hypothetical protein
VTLSTGRDIVLEPKQAGEPLNYFLNPYAEADGKAVKTDKTWNYKLTWIKGIGRRSRGHLLDDGLPERGERSRQPLQPVRDVRVLTACRAVRSGWCCDDLGACPPESCFGAVSLWDLMARIG